MYMYMRRWMQWGLTQWAREAIKTKKTTFFSNLSINRDMRNLNIDWVCDIILLTNTQLVIVMRSCKITRRLVNTRLRRIATLDANRKIISQQNNWFQIYLLIFCAVAFVCSRELLVIVHINTLWSSSQ